MPSIRSRLCLLLSASLLLGCIVWLAMPDRAIQGTTASPDDTRALPDDLTGSGLDLEDRAPQGPPDDSSLSVAKPDAQTEVHLHSPSPDEADQSNCLVLVRLLDDTGNLLSSGAVWAIGGEGRTYALEMRTGGLFCLTARLPRGLRVAIYASSPGFLAERAEVEIGGAGTTVEVLLEMKKELQTRLYLVAEDGTPLHRHLIDTLGADGLWDVWVSLRAVATEDLPGTGFHPELVSVRRFDLVEGNMPQLGVFGYPSDKGSYASVMFGDLILGSEWMPPFSEEVAVSVQAELLVGSEATLISSIRDEFTGKPLESAESRSRMASQTFRSPAREGVSTLRLPPGQHLVRWSAPGYESKEATVGLRPGEARNETISLQPALRIGGAVLGDIDSGAQINVCCRAISEQPGEAQRVRISGESSRFGFDVGAHRYLIWMEGRSNAVLSVPIAVDTRSGSIDDLELSFAEGRALNLEFFNCSKWPERIQVKASSGTVLLDIMIPFGHPVASLYLPLGTYQICDVECRSSAKVVEVTSSSPERISLCK